MQTDRYVTHLTVCVSPLYISPVCLRLTCPCLISLPASHLSACISPVCLRLTCLSLSQEAYSIARQFNLVPPVCEQAEYHYFQRDKVEMHLPELYHKIGTKHHGTPALSAQFIRY